MTRVLEAEIPDWPLLGQMALISVAGILLALTGRPPNQLKGTVGYVLRLYGWLGGLLIGVGGSLITLLKLISWLSLT